jgi:nickel-dependent lactate racemase
VTIAHSPATVTAAVPWGCWYGDTLFDLEFPSHFSVDVLEMRDAPGLTGAAIRAAVERPIGGPRLWDMAAGARSAVIAVDDISRPTPVAAILPAVLDELTAIPPERITILVALGAHRPMIREELLRKLGAEILREYDVQQHHPYENLVDRGRSSRGTPIRLNRTFCEADLRVGVSGVVPHPYMGFGGGAKIVVPGLAGIETLQANHQPAVTGITGGLCDPEVEARKDIEEIALNAGLAFSCNAVVNSRRDIAGLFCGHPIAAHRQAARFCREVYRTDVASSPYDVLCLNSYPKDTELLQAGNAMNVFRSAPGPLVAPNGTVVITTCCSTGRGYHSLHGQDMRLYRAPGVKSFLEGREVVVFSPNLNRRDFEVSFAKEYKFFDAWPALATYLDRKHHGAVSVGVFPHAPLQIFV